jgi:RHS repeat-associated protein
VWFGLFLGSSSLRTAVALGLVGVLTLTIGGSGINGQTAGQRDGGRRHTAAPKPGQRWGSATDGSHLAGKAANRSLPTSMRSRYPLQTLDQQPQPGRNTASVAEAPAGKVRGFDEKTSRELPSARGAHERVYDNTDGTQTTEFSTDPVNYQRSDGSWAPIDTRLTPAGDGAGWRNSADSVDLRLAATADAGQLARLTLDGGPMLSFGLAGAASVAGRPGANGVTYPAVRPGVDLRLEARPGGVKETLVLHSADAPHSYLFPLRLTGLTARLADGKVELVDAAGKTRAVIPAGYMLDAGDAARGPAMSTGVKYRLVNSAGQPALEVSLDSAWLRDKNRRFPVEVDPTVGPPVDAIAADSSMYVHGSSSTSGSSELLVGRMGGENAAAYLKFGDLVSRLQNHTIYGVALMAVNYDSASCRARPVTVHPVTGSWSAGTGYSYPGPAVGASVASSSFAHGYLALGQSQSSCPAAGEMFDLGNGGRALVQKWANGQQANYGLSLRASTTDSSAWKRFAGTGTANPPKLYVTHTPYNASYAIPKPTPEPPVLQNQDGKVKITVTNLGAEDWTPSDYYLAYRAYNAETGAAVGQQRSANLPATLARGAKVTLDATVKAMAPGTYFLDFTMVRTGGVVFTDHQVPPGRIVLQVFDIPPVVQELYPPNGYQAPTLTPQLWARAVDTDAPPGATLQFKFEVCDISAAGDPVNCTNSGYQTKTAWTVPAGRLSWSKSYLWRAFVKDASSEVTSSYSAVLTSVPQPDVTSRIAGAPYAATGKEFDAQTGNFTTAAVDAAVATMGPELNLVRTYNSLDPRRDSVFGAGWSSRYDMKLVPDNDGSGNVVITYPDGQAVRFGKNPDGTYAAPSGRIASLTVDGTSWKLLDKSGTTYQFALTGKLIKITDNSSHSIVLTYDGVGKLAKAQVSNSLTNTAGRALKFTWNGTGQIATVSTDPVNGSALIWTYTYTGELLTRVCAPDTTCATYEYTAGSHYRTAVADARPDSYWRLGESEGTAAASEVANNLGKDAATYRNVTLGGAGVLAGTTNTSGAFNGTSSYLELPKGTVKKSRDAAVELWFKIGLTQTGGPLVGYQDKAAGTAATAGAPVLYTGTDGRLRGQFATGSTTPITSSTTVNDNKWHHVVLSSMGATQTMYLDGVKAGELTGQNIEQSLLTFNQVGAAYTPTPTSWPAWGTTAQRYFAGAIDEVAIYSHPISPTAAAAHFQYATPAAQQLSKVILPSGKIVSAVEYDTNTDRVKDYTDRNGGTWKIGLPTVYGGNTDLRRSVQVNDPANRPYLYEYDALAGWMLRSGIPLGLETRPEDRPGEPTTPPTTPPTETCPQPDPNDPAFCTIIPDDAGGPVFVRHSLDGMAIRSFFYDANGFQNKVVNENGDTVEMTYDDRGNVVTKKTCRTSPQCFTSYYKFPANPTNPYDPRNDVAIETRDGRSASATDNAYRTSYSYAYNGQLASQTNPDGSSVSHVYTNGGEAAVGGGNQPSGLLYTSTDARGKVTRYAYYQNGDLAKLTEPSGLVTEFTYDALGRKLTDKMTSDSYPSGVTTTYTYDTNSLAKTVTGPATTNAVTGVAHQQRITNDYDADGNVVKVTVSDLLGGDPARETSTEYDEYNRAIKVTDPEGNETNYGYDRFGNKTSSVDANGNRYDYAFTAQNKIAEVRLRYWHSDPAGTPDPGTGDYLVLHSYSYDFAGRMASDTDSMGRRLEYQYYQDDLLQKVVLKNFHNPDGSTRDFVVEDNTYDGAGNLTRKVEGNGRLVTDHVVDAAGKVSSTVVDPQGVRRTSTFLYDFNGNVTRSTTSGGASNVPWAVAATSEVVDYTYNDAGKVTDEVVTAGTEKRIKKYAYDRRGLMISFTDPRGNVTGADKAAYTSTHAYDEIGRRVQSTGPAVAVESGGQPATTVNPTASFGYNNFGEQTESKDPRGNISRVEYDKLGRSLKTIQPTYLPPGVTQPVTPTTRRSYDGLGNVTEEIDNSGTTRFGYDQLNRMTTQDEPATTDAERAVTSYTYTRTGKVLSVTDPTGARTESTYDDLDRPVTATRVERRPMADNFTTRMTYDDAGNVTVLASPSGATTTSVFNGVREPIRMTSPAGVTTEYGYDYAGRQIRISDGAGRTTRTNFDQFGNRVSESNLKPNGDTLRTQSYGYDIAGNLTSAKDPYNVVTTYDYDAAGKLVRQVEPVTATKSITTTFGYDEAGNRTRYTDGRGNSTIYTFNSLGLPESVIEPSTASYPNAADRTSTVSYDELGDPVKLTAPGGVNRQRDYDAAGRLRTETGTGGESATADRTLGYDLSGRLTQASAPGGTNTYSYNDQGKLLSTSGPSGAASFGYDPDGNRNSRTDAAGTATFGYVRGRLDSLTDGVTGATQRLGYDTGGDLKTIDYGAGRVRTFGYDDYGRLASDVLRNPLDQTVASVTYGFDLNGHLTSKKTAGTAGAGDNTYGYDQAGRLTSWTGPGGTTAYDWDDSGNRVRAGSKVSTFDERNRLLSDGDYTYTYSARGTLRTRTGAGLDEQYSFDAFDRMASVDGQQYAYDGLDRVADRNGIRFTYAGLGDDVVADGSETYARGPGDELLAIGKGANKRFAISDAHGDVIAKFDPTDTQLPTVNDSTAYDPFGKKVSSAGETSNLGFQGDWTDPATGKVDMGARWYSPDSGSFASRDSVDYSSGDSILANRYTYGAGAPLDFDDPDGHWPSWLSRAASAVSSGWSNFTSTVSSAWNDAVDWGWSKIQQAGSWVYNNVPGVKTLVNKAVEGVRAIKAGQFGNWAKQQVKIAAQKAQEAKVRVTNAARAAVANAVKYTALPAIAALAKPLFSGLRKVWVSTAALAAPYVAVVRQAVADVQKFKQDLYNKAVEKAGALVDGIEKAVDEGAQFLKDHAADIAGIAAGVAVGVGCGVAIGWTGVGALACGALAGAVGSALTGYMNGERGWDLAGTAGMGALSGLIGGAGGIIGGRIAGGLAAQLGGLAGSLGGRMLTGGVAAGIGDSLTQLATTGHIDLGNLAMSTGIGAVTGGFAKARPGRAPESEPTGCRTHSFDPNTRVAMADGTTRPIKDVKVGDKVAATDPRTGGKQAKPVTQLHLNRDTDLTDVTVKTAKQPKSGRAWGIRLATAALAAVAATTVLHTTAHHPFWDDTASTWVNAAELTPGHDLRTLDGEKATVTAVRNYSGAKDMRDLTVADVHTYYVAVGDEQVLVHNCGGKHRSDEVAEAEDSDYVPRHGSDGIKSHAPLSLYDNSLPHRTGIARGYVAQNTFNDHFGVALGMLPQGEKIANLGRTVAFGYGFARGYSSIAGYPAKHRASPYVGRHRPSDES